MLRSPACSSPGSGQAVLCALVIVIWLPGLRRLLVLIFLKSGRGDGLRHAGRSDPSVVDDEGLVAASAWFGRAPSRRRDSVRCSAASSSRSRRCEPALGSTWRRSS
jgi:hypothetical protein